MGLKKGMTNNPAGKPKGTLNKLSSDFRQDLAVFIQEQWPAVINEYNSLDGKEKIKFFLELLPYHAARKQSITLSFLEQLQECLTDQQIDQIINRLKTEQNGDHSED